MNIYYHPFLKD